MPDPVPGFTFLRGVRYLTLACLALATTADAASYAKRPEVQAFIDQQVQEAGLKREPLERLFRSITPNKRVLKLMRNSPEARATWGDYQKIFITKKRIRLGRKFMAKQRVELDKAEQKYGVPANVIAAILGIETYYGNTTGGHQVVRSLATLAFDYPERSSFFRSELAAFLLLSKQQGFAPASLKGSYAGAMGYPQFMPSSYLAYAVDFDQDGVIDIWQGPIDAIGSVANYLARAGNWASGRAVLERVYPQDVPGFTALANQSHKPNIKRARLAELGLEPTLLTQDDTFSLLVMKAKHNQYWIGGKNFYAVTRYNSSALYALAVHQLAEAISQ